MHNVMSLFSFFVCGLFYFVGCYGNPDIYNRLVPSFSQSYASALNGIKEVELVSEFKQCSRNVVSRNLVGLSTIQQASVIDRRFDPVLDAVAQNATGAGMLKWIVLNVKPFVECALSLYEVSKILGKNDQSSIHCVLNFINDLGEFRDYTSFCSSVVGLKDSLDTFVASPRKVAVKLQQNCLNKLALDTLPHRQQVVDYLKNELVIQVKDAIDKLIPLLIDCTYELVVGTNQFDIAGKKISIDFSPCLSISYVKLDELIGTYYVEMDILKYDAYICTRCRASAHHCFIHEMSHYIRQALDGVLANDFTQLLPFLRMILPSKYLSSSLVGLFSDSEEFRDITGLLFVDGKVCFDPFTEAGYMLTGKCLRISHCSSFIPRVPKTLIDKIAEISGHQIKCSEYVQYKELLNLW